MAAITTFMIGRLVEVQAFDAKAYAASAAEQTRRSLPLQPVRGTITDRTGHPLAQSEPAVSVTADPSLTTKHADRIADIVARYLGGTTADYLPKLTKENSRFVYLKRKVPTATYDGLTAELKDKKLPGIFRESDPVRSYPARTIGANVVGFTGGDKAEGLAGVEYAMNAELRGKPGREIYDVAPDGSRIPLGNNVLTPATNGINLKLTIDSNLQWTTERRLGEAVRAADAATGTAIMMNVDTGEVLALANYPSYDAAEPGKTPEADRGNRAVSDAYEPGSVHKLLTMAALADSGTATPDTRVSVPARLKSGDGWITDSFGHGDINLTARGVMAKSSNIGTVLMARQMPKAKLAEYFRSFGLGKPTGIELPGEASGRIPGDEMAEYSRDQIAFGQGLSMTAIQEAAALSAVINGGMYHPPTIIAAATDANGDAVALPKRESRRVVSQQASAMVRDVAQATMADGGTGSHLDLTAYTSGGKTGTAQRIDPTCGCYRGYTASWTQFAPADKPKILTLVVIDQPTKGRFGGQLAGPVAKDMLNFALPRVNVLPDGSTSRVRPLTW